MSADCRRHANPAQHDEKEPNDECDECGTLT